MFNIHPQGTDKSYRVSFSGYDSLLQFVRDNGSFVIVPPKDNEMDFQMYETSLED